MANTYSWILPDGCLNTAPSQDGLTNVVVSVNWRRKVTTIVDEKEYSVENYGQMGCSQPSPEDFTSYPDLTQAQIEGWLNEGLDVAAIDAGLDSQLQNIIKPPVVVYPNPWAPTPTAPAE